MKPVSSYLILIVAVFAVSCGYDRQQTITPSGRTIKVGLVAPFSGSDFSKGQEGLKGAKTAIKMQPLLNNGDRIEIVFRDDQDDPEKSIKAARELIDTEKVAAVVTFSSSSPVLAMANIADTLKTPILAALATHPDVTKNNRYVSQICFDNALQGRVAALFVRDELLADEVAVFMNPDSRYSSSLAAEFESKFTSLGGVITDIVYFSENQTSVDGAIDRVRENEPELLYLPVTAKNLIAIAKLIDQTGWKPKLMAGDGFLATVISQYGDQLDLVEGIMATDFFHEAKRLTPFGERASDALEADGTTYSALGVEVFTILFDAMNRCENPADRECVNGQVRSTSNFESFNGKVSIGPDGKSRRPVVVNAIIDATLEYIVKVY